MRHGRVLVSRWVSAVCVSGLAMACSSPPSAVSDSGTPPSDAGARADAGVAADSGSATDAGGQVDSGTSTDSGTPADAGAVADAGGGVDAGGTADAGTTDGGGTSDAGGPVNVCGTASSALAWTVSIPAPSTSLAPVDMAVGPTNDVVVADIADGATLDQYRWNSSGTSLSHHQDANGAYPGTIYPSSLFIDAQNDVFYGVVFTGMPQGTNSVADLIFERLTAAGTPVFANPQTATMATSAGAPVVEVFQVGGDTGGGLHGALNMGAPQYFAPAVYCWGASGNDVGPAAGNVASTLSPGDFLWPSQDANLYLVRPLAASVDLGCGTLTVPAGGAMVLGKFGGGGNCIWTKTLNLPTAAVKAKNFRLGADASLLLAVVYSGTIDFGGGPMTSSGTSSLALAKFDAAGSLLWSKTFGGAGSSFQLGSVGANAAGIVMLTAGYAGTVDLGGGPLPASSDTLIAVFSSPGGLQWTRTVTVGTSGEMLAAIGPCGVSVATNSPTVDFGTGPISTVTPPAPASIGVAAFGL